MADFSVEADVRIELNSAAAGRLLRGPEVVEGLERRASAITDACNEQSSWGGYKYEVDTDGPVPVARVWTIGKSDRPGGDRALRMVQNMQGEL